MTQEEAAQEAGVSVGAWRSVELGTHRPRPQTFAAVLDVLDLRPDDVHRLGHIAGAASVDDARDELVRLCQTEVPAELVDVVLLTVTLMIRGAEVDGTTIVLDERVRS